MIRMGSCRLERRSPLREDGPERPTRYGLRGRSGVTPSRNASDSSPRQSSRGRGHLPLFPSTAEP
jgi:hypothetical protein